MNRYKIIINKNGASLDIMANTCDIKNNIITFKRVVDNKDDEAMYDIFGGIRDEYLDTVAVFNMDNIVGFKVLKTV